MSAAQEAGDSTLVRTTLKPSPPGLDYKCSCCGKRVPPSKYSAYVNDELKLVLTAACCGRTAQWRIYLAMGGELFKGDQFPFVEDRG